MKVTSKQIRARMKATGETYLKAHHVLLAIAKATPADVVTLPMEAKRERKVKSEYEPLPELASKAREKRESRKAKRDGKS